MVCSQLPDNDNTSVTDMAEYIAVEIIEEHELPAPLTWIEHYPEHVGEIGEWSLVSLFSWKIEEVHLGGTWRYRVGSPRWSHLSAEEAGELMGAGRGAVGYG